MKKEILFGKPLLYSFLLALISLLIWNLDVTYFSGWLNDSPFSVFLICPVIAISLILPLLVNYKIKFNRIYIAVILIYMFSLAGFFISFYIIKLLFWEPVQEISTEKFALLIFYSGLLYSVFTFLVIRILLHKISAWAIMYIFAALLSVMPISLLIIKLIPLDNSDNQLFQTVRYGIPVFVLNILFTLATYISLKHSGK
jgi:hypothetical protein